MTVVEKAAYLRGLIEGLGVEPDSRDGKLWGALTDLLSDMAHEVEDLQACNLDYAEVLDDISEELSYLEELTCDLDFNEMDECDGDCDCCCEDCDEDDCDSCCCCCSDDDDDDDEEIEYDGIVYEAVCPACGEEVNFDEEILAEGFVLCPGCGERLEFELGEEE